VDQSTTSLSKTGYEVVSVSDKHWGLRCSSSLDRLAGVLKFQCDSKGISRHRELDELLDIRSVRGVLSIRDLEIGTQELALEFLSGGKSMPSSSPPTVLVGSKNSYGLPIIVGHIDIETCKTCGGQVKTIACIRLQGKDCSYNPFAFPPSMAVRCAGAAKHRGCARAAIHGGRMQVERRRKLKPRRSCGDREDPHPPRAQRRFRRRPAFTTVSGAAPGHSADTRPTTRATPAAAILTRRQGRCRADGRNSRNIALRCEISPGSAGWMTANTASKCRLTTV
jgi:hypothetical protein